MQKEVKQEGINKKPTCAIIHSITQVGFFVCQEIARCTSHFPVHCRTVMVLHNWMKERRQSRFLVCDKIAL